jgi:hypothetical protein
MEVLMGKISRLPGGTNPTVDSSVRTREEAAVATANPNEKNRMTKIDGEYCNRIYGMRVRAYEPASRVTNVRLLRAPWLTSCGCVGGLTLRRDADRKIEGIK